MPFVLDNKELDHFRTIVTYYRTFKRLTLHFEERYNTTFPPAVLGTRDTLDHIIRSFSAKLSMNDSIPPERLQDYIISNLIASENHLYRAIFELLDVMTAMNRKRITDIVSRYSNETLTVHLPFYYTEVRQFLSEMERKVEYYRTMKDSANIDMRDVDLYISEVSKLEDYSSNIESYVPQMEEYEKETRGKVSEKLSTVQDELTSVKKELSKSRILNYILGALTVASLIVAVYSFLI